MENEESFDKVEFVDSPEQLQESFAAETSEAQPETQPETQVDSQPEVQSEPMIEQQTQGRPLESFNNETQGTEPQSSEPQYSDDEIETSVLNFLSEKLGREIGSIDEFNAPQEEARQLDERVKAISDFVENTGRPPRDWFAYQSLNTSEMDDATAVRVSLASEYPNLAPDEINMLVADKYKLDSDLYSESEMKLSHLQLKIDASKAKENIEGIRQQYNAPEVEAARSKSIVNDKWLSDMSKEVDSLTGLDFDLGNGKSFQFGLNDQYKGQLKDQNSRLDNYFDSFVREDGSWDYDALNSQRAIMDNIDDIVSAAYKQGRGDGQRGLVDKAANVSMDTAQRSNVQNVNSVAEQLKQIIGSGSTTTFKI